MDFLTIVLVFLGVVFTGCFFSIRLLRRIHLRNSYIKSKTSGADESAIRVLEELIKRYPREIENRINLAQLHMKDANYAEAILQLKSILTHERGQRDFDEKKLNILLGECYEGQDNLHKAFDHYEAARKADTEDQQVCRKLGDIQKARGDLNSAASFYRQAHALDPRDMAVCEELAVARAHAGERRLPILCHRFHYAKTVGIYGLMRLVRG
jgi:tetratricopeptide (TPR) repeat protein